MATNSQHGSPAPQSAGHHATPAPGGQQSPTFGNAQGAPWYIVVPVALVIISGLIYFIFFNGKKKEKEPEIPKQETVVVVPPPPPEYPEEGSGEATEALPLKATIYPRKSYYRWDFPVKITFLNSGEEFVDTLSHENSSKKRAQEFYEPYYQMEGGECLITPYDAEKSIVTWGIGRKKIIYGNKDIP